MAIVDPKDSVFANAADAVSDFETIFDDEDSIIEMVEGFGENGESLIGRDPEEDFTTDNSDGKVDMEDSSPSTDFDLEPDAEVGKGVIESEEQTDETNKSDILEEPVETERKDFHDESALDLDEFFGVNEEAEQTDDTNKSDVLEEPVETEDKDFHDEKGGETGVEASSTNKIKPEEDTSKEVKESAEEETVEEGTLDLDAMFLESEEQTDDTNKSDILEEPVETEEKDFHDESALDLDEFFGVNEEAEQTDNEGKDVVKEPDQDEISDFHDGEVRKDNVNEGADLDAMFLELEECVDPITAASLIKVCPSCGCSPCKCAAPKGGAGEEQTDDTNKSDILEEPVETEEKDFHDESALDLDAMFLEAEAEIEGEKDHEEFDDSFEGTKNGQPVKEADEEEIDYAEDELINAADDNDGGADPNLEYQPGEDDVIIDDVIAGKEA